MPNIHQAVLIGAPVESVYNAVHTQEGLSAWWTPNATTEGKLNSLARFPFGNDYFKEMLITEFKPLERISWYCQKGDEQWVGTSLHFNFFPGNNTSLLNSFPEINGQVEQQAKDEATLLIFEHRDWKADTLMFAECSYTWGQFLRSLKLFSETGKGRPWPYQHR